MPATTEKIPEKIPFNVYAMLIILTFVFTGTATWLLGAELSATWHYFDKKEEWPDKAVHITQINKDPEKYPENFELTDTDRKEWDKCVKSLYKEPVEFPEKDYEWPQGFDPLQYAMQKDGDNLTASKDRPDMEKEVNILIQKAGGTVEKTPDAPKADAPKADAPKADAPKTDAAPAPKADDAPKADK